MRDQKARKTNGPNRVKAREGKNDQPEMGMDEGGVARGIRNRDKN